MASCKDNLDINDGFNQLFSSVADGGKGPPTPEAIAQIKATFPRVLAGPLDSVDRDAPEAIKGDVNAATADLRKFGTTGDGSIFENPALKAESQGQQLLLRQLRRSHAGGTWGTRKVTGRPTSCWA